MTDRYLFPAKIPGSLLQKGLEETGDTYKNRGI